MAIFKVDEGGLHADVDRLRLLQKGAGDGDGLDGLVRGLGPHGLQSRAVNARASLNIEHGDTYTAKPTVEKKRLGESREMRCLQSSRADL